MNDRYLFRAKRTDNGEWVEGNRIDDGVTGQVFIHASGNTVNESDKVGEDGCLRFVAFEVDPSTICQCTGRQGEWEHDIFQYNDERYEIQFCEDSLTWEAVSVFSSESIGLGEFSPQGYVRLGSSIDNPELLEAGKAGDHENPELPDSEKCTSCLCNWCDNGECDYRRCKKNQPTKECYQRVCGQYHNMQEDIEEGFLDGYGDL